MKNLLLIFLFVAIHKAVSNYYYKLKLTEYIRDYRDWIKNGNNPEKVFRNSSHLKSLILKAGIKDMRMSASEPIGYGQISTFTASVLDNHPANRTPFSEKTFDMMYKALGVYEQRIKEACNPIYWINAVVFLPKMLCDYIGASYGIVPKIFQVIWWITTSLVTIAFSLYPEMFRATIEKLLYTLL